MLNRLTPNSEPEFLSNEDLESQLKGLTSPSEADYIKFVSAYKPRDKEVFINFVKAHVPKEFLASKEFFFKCFFPNHRIIYCIDDSLKSYEFYKEVILKARGAALDCIPEEFITQELVDLAIAHPPVSFMDIPKKYLTQEICFNFLKTGTKLKRIPEHFRTYEMCLIEAKKHDIEISLCIPVEYQTEELCLTHLAAHPGQLWNIPKDLRTPEVCLFALKQDSSKSIFKDYKEVQIVDNPDHDTTLNNLEILVNKNLIKKTINNLPEEGNL